MTTNNIARLETEENLIQSVESLNIERVKDLLNRFDFNEETLKNLSISIVYQSIDLAELLLRNLSKSMKNQALDMLKKQDKKLYIQLAQRID